MRLGRRQPAGELDKQTHASVTALCESGDALAEAGRYSDALASYDQAWSLLPEPRFQWDAATWILAAIGDSAFLGGDSDLARRALDGAMACPGAIGNPFLHLRRGQVLFDSDELDASADELMRAYMGGGPEIFEDEDPQYLAFLGTRAQL